MTQNDEKNQNLQPQLCTKCNDMYGHANYEYMCSICYKKQKNILKNNQKSKQAIPYSEDQMNLAHLEKQPESVKRQLPKDDVKEEMSKGKCMKCSKKTGILGFTCKHCSFSFCKFHRLPQDHSCEVDYITLGRKKIKSQNPAILTKKIEDI